MRTRNKFIVPLFIFLLVLPLTACPFGGGNRQTTLAQVGLDVNVGLNGGAKFLIALHQDGTLSDPTFNDLKHKLNTAQTSADMMNRQLDALSLVDYTNKPQVIAAIGDVANAVGDILNALPVNPKTQSAVYYLKIAKAALVGASLAVAALKQPSAPKQIPVAVKGVS